MSNEGRRRKASSEAAEPSTFDTFERNSNVPSTFFVSFDSFE